MINCEIGVVYFSTHTPPAEIERLTSYNFSCFTRFKPCAELEELLPAAKEWHLYQEVPQLYPWREEPCDVPAWALARDMRYVLAVEALSTKMVREGEYEQEVAMVRVVGSLKEPAPWVTGSVVNAHPFGWGTGEAKKLFPGRRYVIFATGNDSRDRMLSKDSPMWLERCGVWDDTPQMREELEKGFAQNDALRP